MHVDGTTACEDFPYDLEDDMSGLYIIALAPIDCLLSTWDDWSACSAACGDGTKTRSRTHTVEAQHGGKECEGALDASEECKEKECPVQCTLSDWTPWGACSTTCGKGSRSRSRTVTTEAKHGGKECEDALVASEDCKERECPIDCAMNT